MLTASNNLYKVYIQIYSFLINVSPSNPVQLQGWRRDSKSGRGGGGGGGGGGTQMFVTIEA